MRIFYFDFADNELVHEMDLGLNKRKKFSDSSMIKSKNVNMEAEIVLKSSNHGRQRNLVLESRIDFHASGRFLTAINDHAESIDHNRDRWIVHSVANAHVCNDPKWLRDPVDLSNEEVHVHLIDGKKVKIESFGDVYLKFNKGSFIIRRVAYVTKLSMNVISMAKLHEEGCKILFDDHVTIMRENVTLCIRRKQQRLFELFLEPVRLGADMATILDLEQMITKVKSTKMLSCDIRGWLT